MELFCHPKAAVGFLLPLQKKENHGKQICLRSIHRGRGILEMVPRSVVLGRGKEPLLGETQKEEVLSARSFVVHLRGGTISKVSSRNPSS